MVVDELLAASRSAAAPEVAAGGLDAAAAALPDGVRQMVERQIERFRGRRCRSSEAAALARFEFSAALAAAALEADPAAIEQRCEELARQHQWIRARRRGRAAGRQRQRQLPLRARPLSERPRAARAGRARGCACTAASASGSSACRATRPRRSWPCISNTAATPCARSTICARRRERRWRATPTAKRSPCWRGALALVDRLPPEQRGAERRALLQRRGLAYRAVGDVNAAVEDFAAWAASARAPTAKARKRSRPSSPPARRGRSAIARCSSHSAEEAVERSRSVGDRDLHLRARGYAAHCFARVRGWARRRRRGVGPRPGVGATRRPRLVCSPGISACTRTSPTCRATMRQRPRPALKARRSPTAPATASCARRVSTSSAGRCCTPGLGRAARYAARGAARRRAQRPSAVGAGLQASPWRGGRRTRETTISPPRARPTACKRARGRTSARHRAGVAGIGLGRAPDAATRAPRSATSPRWRTWPPAKRPRSSGSCTNRCTWGSAPAHSRRAIARALMPKRAMCARSRRSPASAPTWRSAIARWQKRRCDRRVGMTRTRALSAARSAVDAGGAPLAEWQVWASAATLAAARGQAAEAADYRARCARVRDQLRGLARRRRA